MLPLAENQQHRAHEEGGEDRGAPGGKGGDGRRVKGLGDKLGIKPHLLHRVALFVIEGDKKSLFAGKNYANCYGLSRGGS